MYNDIMQLEILGLLTFYQGLFFVCVYEHKEPYINLEVFFSYIRATRNLKFLRRVGIY